MSEKSDRQKYYMRIDGIFCDHCKKVLTEALLKDPAIEKVTIQNGIARLTCVSKPNFKSRIRAVNELGYTTKAEYISTSLHKVRETASLPEFAGILAILLLFLWALRKIFGFNVFNMIPAIDSSITYGMLVVTGLLTSIHCVSMCGALNLTAAFQSQDGKKSFLRPIFYNAGRLLSYTAIGCAAGALGSVFSISPAVSGAIILVGAGLMLLMALKMLGVIDLPELWCFRGPKAGGRNAFVIGLLNGFMPCGPLQAMQLYALSAGSALAGGTAMLLFGLGTVPLMLSMGVFVNVAKGKWRTRISKAASVVMLVLAVTMLSRGLLALNVDVSRLFSRSQSYDGYTAAVLHDGYQEVELELDFGSYGDFVVLEGVPVRLNIHAPAEHITGCNNEVVFRDFGVSKSLLPGDNIIEFTPEETGEYTYTCWMNMIRNHIQVIDDADYFEEA